MKTLGHKVLKIVPRIVPRAIFHKKRGYEKSVTP